MTFAPFYEFFEKILGLFKNQFSIVFITLYKNGGYNIMGLILLFTPLLFLIGFYFLWKYPYATRWHWFIYIGIIAIFVGGLTYNKVALTLADFLVSSNQKLADFSSSLVFSYAILNAILSLLVSFVYSLIFKRFSKIQMHLPF